MTLVPRFCIRLAIVLSIAALVGLPVFNQSASAQTTDSKPDPNRRYYTIVRAPGGGTLCRTATAEEAATQLRRSASGQQLHQINHLFNKSGPSTEVNGTNPGGLNIYLFGTPQLENFPAAKAAFIRAAAAWEAVIKTPISVYLRVDYGPTAFGDPWDDPDVIGATGTLAIPRDYTSVRTNLIISASNNAETTLYNLLPSGSVPTDSGNAGTMALNVSLARALGFIAANTDITAYRQEIAFNSAFDFDTDSSDGVTAGQMDFEAVATHEIGHALGFDSSNGEGGTPPRMSVWDLFRFRPGVTDFTNTQRIMTIGGGLQVYYAGGTELGLATGGPDPGPTDGDGDQSSHWRDNHSSNFNTAIGIMDPNIALGTHEFIKQNDISALNFMGYNMEFSATPPPPPPPPSAPANDNFANAQVISGCTGNVNGTNIGATKQAGEPSHSPDNNPGGASVWYQWQSPSTGSVTITTAGSNFDTLLAVYTGTSVNALTLLGRNDDASTTPHVLTSSVTFNATAGTTYRIAVDGYDNGSGGDSGNIILNWTAQNCTGTPTCTYTISPTSQNFTSAGATGVTVSVTTGSTCAWAAQSNNTSFITITGGASGTGNGTVTYSVAANPGGTARTGTMTIAGQTFTVTQDAASCSYSLSSASQPFNSIGGTGSTNITAAAGCAWNASSNDSWIIVNAGSNSGTGNGTVSFTVQGNTGVQRTGTITIAGQTFTVTQASGCTYSISPTNQNYGPSGGNGSVNVMTNASCPWTAQSNNPWITITSGSSGVGNNAVNFSVDANNTITQRTGTITVAGQTFTVTQAGISCSFSIAPTTQSFSASGSTGIINVTSPGGCNWTATSNNPSFITITSGSIGTGNGAVGFSVSGNTTGSPRSGTITVAGQTFTVTQDGCVYSLSQTLLNAGSSGGGGIPVNVTSSGSCGWSAVSNDPFITVTGGAIGTGNGTVSFSVAANPNPSQRLGSISIAGQTFFVAQDGISCNYSISSNTQNFTANGGSGSTGITTTSSCSWTVVSLAPWITVTSSGAGTGNTTVTYTVAANPGQARIGTIIIAGQAFTVTQNAPLIQLGQSLYNVSESAGSVAILVNRSGDLSLPMSVNYTTTDASNFLQNCNVTNGKATSRCDYISLVGTLHFAAGENSKTLFLPIVDDTYLEGAETFFISLSNPTGGAIIGSNQLATITISDNGNDGIGLSNPIDDTTFFVRQHYMDFLGREPDPSSVGWVNQIANCVPSQPSCDRLSVSQGIYGSPEFKDRGYFIYKFYSVTFGRKPSYDEFVLDRARVSGFQSDAELEQSKLDFISDFMSRAEFAPYKGLTDDQYVLTLFNISGVTQVTVNGVVRDVTAMQQLMHGGRTRGQILRDMVESPEVSARFLVESTIVMHYFGYLRRDPDAAYQNWINIFNQTGDSRNVTNGFVNSAEYRNRFNQ